MLLYINQPARRNVYFLVHEETTTDQWRPVTHWENPIWGWVVINYADQGLQFFTSKGHFFREVRVAQGINANTNCQPFPAPNSTELSDTSQLSHFIDHIIAEQKNGYLEGMMDLSTRL